MDRPSRSRAPSSTSCPGRSGWWRRSPGGGGRPTEDRTGPYGAGPWCSPCWWRRASSSARAMRCRSTRRWRSSWRAPPARPRPACARWPGSTSSSWRCSAPRCSGGASGWSQHSDHARRRPPPTSGARRHAARRGQHVSGAAGRPGPGGGVRRGRAAGGWPGRAARRPPGRESRVRLLSRPNGRGGAESREDRPAAPGAGGGRAAPAGGGSQRDPDHAASQLVPARPREPRRPVLRPARALPVTPTERVPGLPSELTVILPVFNEGPNLAPLWVELAAVLDAHWARAEVIFVDDASTDGGSAWLRALAAADGRVRLVRFAGHAGLTAALEAGCRLARSPIIVTMDSDLQNDPADIPRLVAALAGADVATGTRVRRDDPWLKRVSSRVANAVRNAVTGETVRDSACTLRAMRRECAAALPPFDGMHRFLPTLMRLSGFRVVE